jgi:hypothetical protein
MNVENSNYDAIVEKSNSSDVSEMTSFEVSTEQSSGSLMQTNDAGHGERNLNKNSHTPKCLLNLR